MLGKGIKAKQYSLLSLSDGIPGKICCKTWCGIRLIRGIREIGEMFLWLGGTLLWKISTKSVWILFFFVFLSLWIWSQNFWTRSEWLRLIDWIILQACKSKKASSFVVQKRWNSDYWFLFFVLKRFINKGTRKASLLEHVNFFNAYIAKHHKSQRKHPHPIQSRRLFLYLPKHYSNSCKFMPFICVTDVMCSQAGRWFSDFCLQSRQLNQIMTTLAGITTFATGYGLFLPRE